VLKRKLAQDLGLGKGRRKDANDNDDGEVSLVQIRKVRPWRLFLGGDFR